MQFRSCYLIGAAWLASTALAGCSGGLSSTGPGAESDASSGSTASGVHGNPTAMPSEQPTQGPGTGAAATDTTGAAVPSNGSTAGGQSSTDPPASSVVEPPPPTDDVEPSQLTPRIRRLTDAEYDQTVQALLGTTAAFGADFVPDARQFKFAKFDRNEAQIVDPLLARQLQQAAESLASEYVASKLTQALPCASNGDAACATQFFTEFLPKAFRRAVPADELDAFLSIVVTPAIARDGFTQAIALGIEAALQSAAFLYHTEIGAAGPDTAPITMTQAEIASELSYLLTGGPPDAELAAADLLAADVREAQARRLIQTAAARPQVRRLIKQWLDIDSIADIGKDNETFGNYESLRPKMAAETDAFIDEVVFTRGGDFKLLLGADFTVGSKALADFYKAPQPATDPGIIDLTGAHRRGILNQAAFLTIYATAVESSPVRRGARFLTQALCIDPGDPNALQPPPPAAPPPDPNTTVRARFEAHAGGTCVGCHNMIDSVGFTFEHFNAIGEWKETQKNSEDDELMIDSATTLVLPAGIPFASQAVADSAELATLVSESEAGRRCFARNLARFTTATHAPSLEQGFVDVWKTLAAAGNDSVLELLVAYTKTDFFVQRDPQGDVE